MNSTSSPPSSLPDANAAPASSRAERLFARFPSFALALAMTIVGTNVGIGKTMVAVMPVAAFALWRFVIAVIALSPRYRPSAMRRVTRTQWLHLFVQTFFGTFLFTLLMLSGVRMTTATAAGVITATLPACVALLSWAVLREPPSRRALASVALAIAGVALLNVSRGDSHGAGDTADAGTAWLGNALVLGAVACEAIYVIASKRLAAELPAIDICAYTHLLGGAMMLPFGIAGLMAVDYAALTPGHWALVVWYGLAASVFSFFLWMRGIRHVSAQLAGVFTAMVPVAATAYGVIFLGERLTVAQGAALALTIAGIVLAALPPAGACKTGNTRNALLHGRDGTEHGPGGKTL
ncbi:EamA family transporter [Pandoraea nosoerga]|uniref:EamA family transporter n=1 Tax=Pandoraea nosoerga TaxID=2508296 RepID=A0A5E4XJ74_9BURK|nr:EamA family transporter [Pandoraea nosoerga]